jgi:hypothetical protein
MKTLRLALVAAGTALALACAPKMMRGTDIRDTPDTRAIANLLEAYRQAMEKRDTAAIVAMTAPDYFDNSGTPDPGDDVDRGVLAKRLEELQKVNDLRLTLGVRGISVGQSNEARAEVNFDQFYRVTTPNGPVARHDTDVHRFTFKKIDGKWLFESGL